MMKLRISLFAEQEREDRRAKLVDPLEGLAEYVDFEAWPRASPDTSGYRNHVDGAAWRGRIKHHIAWLVPKAGLFEVALTASLARPSFL